MRKVVAFLSSIVALALPVFAQNTFNPGELFLFGAHGIYRVPLGGGFDLPSVPPFAQYSEPHLGQAVWNSDRTLAYFTAGTSVYTMSPNGAVAVFATGLSMPTGIAFTTENRLLVVERNAGTVKDVTAGGDATTAPVFASGLEDAVEMLRTSDGRILIATGFRGIYDISRGGDFSQAEPFAQVPGACKSLAENARGRIYVSSIAGGAGIYDITEGGVFQPEDRHMRTDEVRIACVGNRLLAIWRIDPRIVRDVTHGGDFLQAPVYASFKVIGIAPNTFIAVVPGTPHPVSTEAVIAKGDAVPGAGGALVAEGSVFRTVGIPALSDSGYFAFAGNWKEGRNIRHGIFVKELGNLEDDSGPAVVTGMPVPFDPAASFGSFAPPLVTDDGEVVFLSNLRGVPNNRRQALFTNIGGGLQRVVQAGDEAPGTNGATFKRIVNVAVGRSSGDAGATAVYFTAVLAREGGVTYANDLGLWEWREGTLRLLLREGAQVEGSGTLKSFTALTARRNGGTSTSGQGHGVEQGDVDRVWVRVQLTGGMRAVGFVGTDGLSLAYHRGEPAPGYDSAAFKLFGRPTQNVNTAGAFLAEVKGPGVKLTNNTGIFAEDDAYNLNLVVSTGDVANGYKNAWFAKLRDPVTATGGRLAFTARIAGDNVTKADDEGIWITDGSVAQLAREGRQSPGVAPGAKWRIFTDVALPQSSHFGPIFVAKMVVPKAQEPNPAGITSTNDTGFWITDSLGFVQLAIREGQTLEVGGVSKTVRNFRPLYTVPGSAAQTRSHTNGPALLYQVIFTDGSTAIVKTEVPVAGGPPKGPLPN